MKYDDRVIVHMQRARVLFTCALLMFLLLPGVMPSAVYAGIAVAFAAPSAGLNKFDLVKQYLGTASGGDGSTAYRRVTQAMARKAIADASEAGVTYFRVAAAGFAPAMRGEAGDLDLWVRDRTAYWALYDQMMSDLQKSGVRIIPTFAWNITQFPAMTGETVPELLRNPASKSYGLLSRFVTEFVERYRGHRALMFYELTNELNLGADRDVLRHCRSRENPRLCEPKGNYTTADMMAFTSRLAVLIHGLDPSRPISSGFSVPRPNAQQLRQTPEWVTKKTKRRPDTREEFEAYLADTHKGMDIISVHLYAKDENRRFGSKDEVDLLNVVQEAAGRIGKPLFLGEFGDRDASQAAAGSYAGRMLDRIAALRVPYSAIWTWEFYQKKPYATYDTKPDSFNLEPGYTDQLIEKLKQVNGTLGNPVRALKGADTTAPKVVVTWPIECSLLNGNQKIYAVASDDRGKVGRVEFWLDDTKIGTDSAPPYEVALKADGLAKGEHTLAARAFDGPGNSAEYKTVVVVGAPAKGGVCFGVSAQ